MPKEVSLWDFHKVLIDHDPEFMERYEALISLVSTKQRTLEKKSKRAHLYWCIDGATGRYGSYRQAYKASA